MRYAIDQKPMNYTSITVEENNRDLKDYNNKYGTNVDGQGLWTYIANNRHYIDSTNKITYCDWREIIYQMAKDYYQYAHILNDFEYRLIQANPNYPTGKTGYENYYIDLVSFWRELYDLTLTEANKSALENEKKNTSDAVSAAKASI
jgi:hypothetical protein